MSWTVPFDFEGNPFDMDSGGYRSEPGVRLCLPLETLENITDIQLLEIMKHFKQTGREVYAINRASEAEYNEKYVSRDDLNIIINGQLADETEKQAAYNELLKRDRALEKSEQKRIKQQKTQRRVLSICLNVKMACTK